MTQTKLPPKNPGRFKEAAFSGFPDRKRFRTQNPWKAKGLSRFSIPMGMLRAISLAVPFRESLTRPGKSALPPRSPIMRALEPSFLMADGGAVVKIVKRIGIGVGVLLVFGFLYQRWAEHRDATRFPPPAHWYR